jgi:HK97 gp10 family phage protein
MPNRISFEIKGAREMENLLKQLGPRPAAVAGDAALRAAAKPIIAEAKRLVPKRTKALMRSITAAPNTRKRRPGEREYFIGFKRPISARAHLTEFGTSRSPASPFMRPAMDTRARQALLEMGRILGVSIEKEAEKLLKRGR